MAYRPYRSDSESSSGSDSGTESDVSYTTDSTSSDYASRIQPLAAPNFRALAQGLSLTNLGGGNTLDPSGNLLIPDVLQDILPGFTLTSGYPTFKNYEVGKDASGEELKSSSQSVNSIVMLDSRDRDRNVFVQPTNVTLRLPRVYSNVTSFQLVQIKFLSAFYYFRAGKANTSITIEELNRTVTDLCGNLSPNIITSRIREGTYDINSLLSEITTRLNITPIFYDFPNGFQDFAPRFAATGDYTIGFNYPGDNYYDSLLDQYIPNPTIGLIVSKYFQGQYAGRSSYSTGQMKVAYYYPVLKEYLLDTLYSTATPLNLTLVTSGSYLLPGETAYSRIVYTFQGIDDPVILEVIIDNTFALDAYRLKHTFRYGLINKYNVSYETQSNRVTISCPSLNTSLLNLINFKQAQSFSEELNKNGIDQATYNTYNAQNTVLLAVLNDMFYTIQRWLAFYFGINFNTYSLDYVATPTNPLPLRDAYQAVGVSSNFDSNVISRNLPVTETNILDPLRQSAKQYWNRLTNLPQATIPFPFNLETGNPATSSNYPYSVLLEEQDRVHKFVDASGYLYVNKATRFSDFIVPIEASKYTVLRFRSPVRQTLQVETLPRPTAFRYPAYNAIAYDLSQQKLFDNSYSFIESVQNSKMDINASFASNSIVVIPGFSTTQNTFGASYASSIQQWGANVQQIQVGDTRRFFQLETPPPPGFMSTLAPGYRYPLSLTLTASTTQFTTPMNMYLYHDRGAFMADISDNRNEKPINYLTSVSTTTNSTTTLTFPVYANQKYYVLARSVDTAIASQSFRVVPWFPNGSTYTALTSSLTNFDPLADPSTPQALSNYNYAVNADPAYIRLPIQSTIQSPSGTLNDPLSVNLTFSTAAMGYDVNGVSTDLTNYCGFVANQPLSNGFPTASIRTDPITGYSFQVGTGYDEAAQVYLTMASGNAILQPQGGGLYTPGKITGRDYTEVHWYGTTYLPNSENQAPMTSNLIVSSNIIQPYTNTTTNAPLAGYTYGGSNNAIQFGDGVFGLSFVPNQGVWDIERMMFKSVYTTGDPETDGNLKTAYIGVYYSALTTDRFVHEIPLSNALAVLKFSKSVTYTSNSLDLGFDAAGGTYYEFVRDSTFRTGSNSYLYGYSEIKGQVNFDINSIYSFIPFGADKVFNTFDGVVGSAVPYPYYSDASGGTVYFDKSTTPTGAGIVLPITKASPDVSRGPPAGYDQTQSKYEQSPPIGTNLLQYITPYPFALLSNTMKPWDPLPCVPSIVVADVSGYILTQDSFYRVFQYSSDTANDSLREAYQFTLDQIYSPKETDINFIGVAANEQEYAFFAYSNLVPSVGLSNKLLIRTMNPFDGSVRATYEMVNLPGFDPQSQEITTITYNNFGGFTLGLTSPSTFTAICKHSAATSTMTTVSALQLGGSNSNITRFITRQTPKEEYGSFYVFPFRESLGGSITTGMTDYLLMTPSNTIGSVNPNYAYTSYSGEQDTWPTNYPTQMQVINLSTTSNLSVFKQPIISRQPFKDYIYLLSDSDTRRFYQVTGFTSSNSPLYTSNASITTSTYEFPVATSNFTQGANGAKWSLVGNTLYGNRNDIVDSPRKIYQAWQIFYPLMRVVFRQISKNFTFLNNRDSLDYAEYPHTCMIGYNSYSTMVADISGRWGLESSNNFSVADFGFRGSIFNSFMFTFPLQKSTGSNDYYLAIRNYSPTEKSQVLLRTSLTNQYDFGYTTMMDLSGEVPLLSTSSNMFNPDYFTALSNFNSQFIIGSNGKTFGANIIAGFAGSNFSNVTGFGEFYAEFVHLYNQYNSQVQLVQTITSNVNAYVTNFIQTDLQYILPPSALNRQRFTDPLTFSILWKSALVPQFAKLEEQWGMGWNLGFDKADTSYQTVHVGQSFFKILDDFINLQMNREFDMNRMDTGAKENLAATQEPTGFTKAFHGKLLLAPFGSYAQTLVSNPVSFYPPLGRMDKLTFTWVDVTGATLNNADCEWNAVVQIVEKKDMTEIVQAPRIDPTVRTMKK
jgi:hypothetical protein